MGSVRASRPHRLTATKVLDRVLAVLLPGPEQSLLLRAGLTSGPPAADAWRHWRALVGNPVEHWRGVGEHERWFLPVLHDAVQDNGVDVGADVATALRAARVREELRQARLLRACAEVLERLASGGVDGITLKGVALGETAYRGRLRHSHDLDLLVAPSQREAAGRALGASPDGLFQHRSGLPVRLHTTLTAGPEPQLPFAELRARARTIRIGGAPATVLCPTDTLFHVCTHNATTSDRRPLRWACDTWHVVARDPDLDWDLFAELCRRTHSVVVARVLLDWLHRVLEVPAAAAGVARLSALDELDDSLGRDLAMAAARSGPGADIRSLLKEMPTWRHRVQMLRWLALPSAGYLELTQPSVRRSGPIARHIRRYVGYGSTRLRRFGRRGRVGATPGSAPAQHDRR